jgi:hypothetical protein
MMQLDPLAQRPRDDLTGQTFDRLTVLSFAGRTPYSADYWQCRCVCGTYTLVHGKHLRRRKTRSCGCLARELTSRRRTSIHGHHTQAHRTRTYVAWVGMLQRCYNPKSDSYAWYGARGIHACEAWRHSFPAFLHDMGECPPKMTLDRLDNDLGYSPENCRWATTQEQAYNKRTNRLLTFRGVTQPMAAWEKDLGFSHGCLKQRLQAGWTVERALTTPLRRIRRAYKTESGAGHERCPACPREETKGQ